MIQVGLVGWGDHDKLYSPDTAAKDKLRVFGTHFPPVELDSSFYAVQPPEMALYAEETPENFRFVVKAYQGTTGHLSGKPYYRNDDDMYADAKAWLPCGKRKERIERLRAQSETVGIILNNNSGGHAAGNAKRLMKMFCIPVTDFPSRSSPEDLEEQPEQLDLF